MQEFCGSGYSCSISVDIPVVQHLFIDEECISVNPVQLQKNVGREAVQQTKEGQTRAGTDELLAITEVLGAALGQLLQPDHRSRLMARRKAEKKLIFRQLLVEGEQRMLQAPNQNRSNRIIPIKGNCSIGVMMGKVESFI